MIRKISSSPTLSLFFEIPRVGISNVVLRKDEIAFTEQKIVQQHQLYTSLSASRMKVSVRTRGLLNRVCS